MCFTQILSEFNRESGGKIKNQKSEIGKNKDIHISTICTSYVCTYAYT